MPCIECKHQPQCTEPCQNLEEDLSFLDTQVEDLLEVESLNSTEDMVQQEFKLKNWHDDAIEQENQFPGSSVTNAEGLPPCKAKEHSKYRIG